MAQKELKRFSIIPKLDYDQEVKLQKQKIQCYSKDQLDELYPDEEDYRVIGEIKAKNKKEEIGFLPILTEEGETVELSVTKLNKHSRLLYRKAGYVCVGPDTYLALLKFRFLFLLLFFGLLLGILAGIGLLLNFLLAPKNPKTPVNPLPDPDPYIKVIPDDEGEKGDPNAERGSVSMEYTVKATLDLSDDQLSIYFRNPKRSNKDVVVELYMFSGDQEILIARSGRISAGYALYRLDYIKDAVALKEGTFRGMYKVIYYNPLSGERALVESEIDEVEIQVQA